MSERNEGAKDGRTPALSGVFSQGILKDNPVLRQMLGLCSTLAITTAVTNGIGMGAATTFVLVCSGVVVSLLRRVIPTTVRLPAYITIVASFVTLVQMLVRAHAPALDESLGIYLPLIVVNCIVLGRAEAFASKGTPVRAAADGLGMGVGYTLALVLVSAIRELLGAGTLLGGASAASHRGAPAHHGHAGGGLRHPLRRDGGLHLAGAGPAAPGGPGRPSVPHGGGGLRVMRPGLHDGWQRVRRA